MGWFLDRLADLLIYFWVFGASSFLRRFMRLFKVSMIRRLADSFIRRFAGGIVDS